MKRFVLLLSLVPLLLLGACTSAEERAARAAEEVANQRLELIQQHQDCVEEANGDQTKIDACETYLHEADALK
jgi:outer membrane biogenesis lipoprotein LolB